MPYATIADIRKWLDEDVLIQLTDDADTGATNTEVVAAALADANAVVDGYLGARHTLPLASPPAILIKLETDIAIVMLYNRRNGPPEHWQKQYDNAIAFLTRVNEGKITLGPSDPDGTGSADTAEVSKRDAIFTRDTLENW